MSFDVGDVATLTYNLTVSGTPTDATVALTVTAPDGTVTTPAVSHTGLGAYEANVPVNQAGRWSYAWTASGAATDVERGVFTVGGAVSLAEMKKHLNMSGAGNDAELQRFIDVAEAALSNRVGPLTPVTVTERHDGGAPLIVLRQPRAVSLTSVTYADGTASTLSDYDLDSDTGVLYWNYGTAGRFAGSRRNVTVTYVAGWASLPLDLVDAVKELVRELWETQRGASSGVRPGFTDNDDNSFGVGGLPLFPPRVEQLIAPYVVPTVA